MINYCRVLDQLVEAELWQGEASWAWTCKVVGAADISGLNFVRNDFQKILIRVGLAYFGQLRKDSVISQTNEQH